MIANTLYRSSASATGEACSQLPAKELAANTAAARLQASTGASPAGLTAGLTAAYFSRTRVPRIFWLLSALRKLGTSRSISSKYDDSAGVFCCAL